MENKLILFDVDDTIIDHGSPKSKIPKETRFAIKALKEKGYCVGLATGRSFPHIAYVMKTLELDTAVSFGGHLVTHQGKDIFKQAIDREESSRLIKKIIHTPFPMIAIDEKNIYIKDLFGRVRKELFRNENILEGEEPVVGITPIKKLDTIPRDYLSMMIFRQYGLKQLDFKKLDFNAWGKKGYEVYSKGISKLSGIHFLANYLDIPMNQVYVFGDSYNDLHMLEHIKNSVAVGNGVKEAKAVASYVSPPISEGGILTACYHLGLLEEEQ